MTTTLPNLGVHIRWMIRRDLRDILAIEAASFAEPWAEDDFLHHLRHRNRIGMVAESKHDSRVLGYMLYELHPNHLHLLNLAVAPAVRGRGLGTALVAKLVHKVETHGRLWIGTTIGERNAAGLAFFRACGFRAVGLARGRFTDGDGIDMAWRTAP